MKIIDKSTNTLEYESNLPIIYIADIYFKELKIVKGIKKINDYLLKEQVYCNTVDYGTNEFFHQRWKDKLKIKEPKNDLSKYEFSIEKIILKKKIGYSQIQIKNHE